MKDRPILFKAAMVRAILEGRKTETRRVIPYFDGKTYATSPERARWQFFGDVEGPKAWRNKWFAYAATSGASALPIFGLRCRYGLAGDRLWVKETYSMQERIMSLVKTPIYRADEAECRANQCSDGSFPWRWTPAIHMPRIASRITLAIEQVRVERLHEITDNGSKAEGIDEEDYGPPPESEGFAFDYRAAYEKLWDSINAARGFPWRLNPWVFVVRFRSMT